MINSRDIDELNPKTADLCRKFMVVCRAEGIDILITSTYRDYASQDTLYTQGRTAPGGKITNARGGYSWHNFRRAFDFIPIVNGKAQWNDFATFKKCGNIGKSLGLEWAGDWKTFKEYAHMQFTDEKTLAQLREEHKDVA
jgi:peptidoglycan L-alanyl-D-glutamate endopeptidase CwlK